MLMSTQWLEVEEEAEREGNRFETVVKTRSGVQKGGRGSAVGDNPLMVVVQCHSPTGKARSLFS